MTGAPRAFRTAEALRAWLAREHRRATELVLRCYRVHAAARGVTYAQALDEALCVGWIDGIRRALDADSFSVRFTPRKPRSTWSLVNVRHVERLIAAGRMTPAGEAAFAAREASRTGIYSFEQRLEALSPELERRFRARRAAWRAFGARPPGYRRTCIHWVMSARQEATRLRRLEILATCSERGEKIPPLARS